ncbi:ScbR family autoregulator-binding transcription factor [Leifsonia poae]|uniref:TetR family transcriptional regulator n=1 Tax=Leifsonia poae TaxID=110933 RepID=A0A9W6H766_9MICO|nr:ScbR family autoregulator-binding transcription factor [Leifsonia poae]GLJ75231.1 TetR family transcriptional regulator [Leifsonia poae]
MVKQARARATRDAIIRGAAEVFERNGYGIASISDIASAAAVTKGALYFHFQSKDDLAHAVIARQHELAFSAGALVLEQGRPALESMVLLCAGLGRQLVTDPVVQAGIRLTTEVSNFERPVADPYEDWLNTFEELARRAIEEGDIAPTVDPAMLAHFIIPAYTGIQLVSATLADRTDLLQRIRELWIVLLPGIVPADRLDALRRLPELIPTSA